MISSTDGSMLPASNNSFYLPEAHGRNGFRCNAGSRDCDCIVPPRVAGQQATVGPNGRCAKYLQCDAGICRKTPYVSVAAPLARTPLLALLASLSLSLSLLLN